MFQVKSKLKGHQKRITGLAFSTNLNILVSSGADAQVSLLSVFHSYNIQSGTENLSKWISGASILLARYT